MFSRLLILFIVLFIIEFYAFQAVKTLVRSNWGLTTYKVISALLLAYIIYSFTKFDRSVGQTQQTMVTLGLLLLVYIPKITLTLVLMGEDLFRLALGSFNRISKYKENTEFITSRRRFVSQIGLGLAAIPFLSLLYGVTKGKYNFKVIKQTLFFPDLPDDFEGFKVKLASNLSS